MTTEKMQQLFQEAFQTTKSPKVYFAPGRVNLIGEHTDYNGGHVFPCALTIGTYGAIVKRRRPQASLLLRELYSVSLPLLWTIWFHAQEAGWTNYPKGVMWTFDKTWIYPALWYWIF